MTEAGKAPDKKPSRSVALLLGLIGPCGIGQYYLGQRRRAVGWLVLPAGALVLGVLALGPAGAVLGYGKALAVLLGGCLVTWLGSLVDAFRIPEARLTRVRARAVVGFWVAGILTLIALRVPLRAFVLEAFKIPSGSMQPTLLIGEHVMADKFTLRGRPPKQGEVVVFQHPEHPEQDFLKRVIAVPGDQLELKHGHPWLNGREVPHCPIGKATLPDSPDRCSGTLELEYLDDVAYLTFFDECADTHATQGPYRVAPGEVWVLGDNRNNSFDSPSWFGGRGGGLPLDHVKGRALFRWYTPTDWSRYGTAFANPLLPSSMQALGAAFAKCLASRPPR